MSNRHKSIHRYFQTEIHRFHVDASMSDMLFLVCSPRSGRGDPFNDHILHKHSCWRHSRDNFLYGITAYNEKKNIASVPSENMFIFKTKAFFPKVKL